MPLKVAIYSGAIPSTEFVENLIEGLAKEGVLIYLFGRQLASKTYPVNVHCFPTPALNRVLPFFALKEWLLLIIRNPKKAKDFYQYLLAEKIEIKHFIRQSSKLLPLLNHPPDIFHIQWAKMAPSLLALKPFMNNCWVISFRGAHINYSPIADPALAASYQETFPQVEGFHAVSQAIAQEGVKYGASLKKTRVIKPSVKKELLNEFEKNKPKSNSKLQLISIGRFHWKKGYQYALDALKMVKDRGIVFHYTIIAKGDQEEILYQIHDLGLQKEVTIIPGLSHDQVVQKLKESDLFLLPSVEEGIANVVLEAMAVGVPVVSTNCGGMDEAIENGENGWLVSVRDSEAIANAIQNFLKRDQKFVNGIKTEAYFTIKQKHILQQQVKELIDFYSNIFRREFHKS